MHDFILIIFIIVMLTAFIWQAVKRARRERYMGWICGETKRKALKKKQVH